MSATTQEKAVACDTCNTPEQPIIDRGQDVMEKIGIDPVAQSERAKKLIATLGDEGLRIAHKEHEQNERSYFREFVLDEPVSEAHEFYMDRGKFYSDQYTHEQTQIDQSIDPREREGKTLDGFRQFEDLIANPRNKSSIWYSPAGRGGNLPPFNKLFYESGRLYLCYKGGANESFNFDIKIQEQDFPIRELLQHLSGDKNQDLFHYLARPYATEDGIDDFLKKMENFMKNPAMVNNPTVYTARRHDTDSQVFKWTDIIQDVKTQLAQKLLQPRNNTQTQSYLSQEIISRITQADYIEGSLYARMRQHMQATGKDQLFLYGCSTTSVFGNKTEYSRSIRSIVKELTQGASSIYATVQRLRGASQIDNDGKKDPDCVTCPKCNHLGVDINSEGRYVCPECESVGPPAS